MKTLTLTLLMTTAVHAQTETITQGRVTYQDVKPHGDQAVLVLIPNRRIDIPEPPVPVGQTVSDAKIALVLYLDYPCQLPIAEAKHMHRFADPTGVGCWAPTLNGGFAIIQKNGREYAVPGFGGYQTAIMHMEQHTLTITKADATP